MFVLESIQLSDCPEILQESINKYLDERPQIELLSVKKIQSTPYKDKSIIDTTYKAYTLHGNYFCVFKTSVSSKSEWTMDEVSQSCMLAGEISEIVKLSPEWFKDLKSI